jgi:hypothetical protein
VILRLHAAILLALLLLSAPLDAQDPAPVAVLKLSAPATVNVGDLATVSVDPSSNVQDVQFVCVPMPSKASNWAPHGDFAELVCGADCPDGGVFTIVAAANLNGKTITATTTVTFGAPKPPPEPPPPPGPPPALATHLRIVTLDDAGTRTPETAAVLNDAKFWASVFANGHQMWEGTKDNPDAAPFFNLVPAGVGLPAILFIDADKNKTIEADRLPGNTAEIAAIIAKLTGKSLEDK